MNTYWRYCDINLGRSSHATGHEAYLNAQYKVNDSKTINIIFKKNKFGIATFSRLEASFSQLARLFLKRGLTAPQHLVRDGAGHIVGVAVEHLSYAIEQRETLDQGFYTLDEPWSTCETTLRRIEKASQIPIYFLDKLPQGFFARLLNEEKHKRLTIDYDSLASILGTSYTFEEDDLHKGNFGFYLVEKEGRPQAVFFKIDHDLMFVDSIMGFESRRISHLMHGPGAFNIYAEDLLSFPYLKFSANSYWPTKFGYISNPLANKEYHSFTENAAFADLAKNKAFIKGKWKSFYKHILIPRELIDITLNECSERSDSVDRAHNALIAHALLTRLAHLRATLFSIKEFREFVIELTNAENDALLDEIVSEAHPTLTPKIRTALGQYKAMCSSAAIKFEEGDTPLHTMIKLGEYRYEETSRMFGQFINTPNGQGKTPFDIAYELYEQHKSKPEEVDPGVGNNMCYIMQHLLKQGARKTPTLTASQFEEIMKYKFPNPYLKKVTAETSYRDFKNILRDIGEDHQFCLKYQKNLAIECIKEWIDLRTNKPNFRKELKQLKNDINGKSPENECAGLKYLRQLRSKLWIIRQLRGLYGWTSTQAEINTLITQKEAGLAPKRSYFGSFFADKTPEGGVPAIADLSFGGG